MTRPESATSDMPATSNNTNNIAMIYSNNWLVHIVNDASGALQQKKFVPKYCGVVFYDVEGHQLVPMFDTTWRMTALRRAGDGPRHAMLRRRLQTWLTNLQSFAEEDVAQVKAALKEYDPRLLEGKRTAADYLALLKDKASRVPEISGKPLRKCFDLISDFLGGNDPGDDGDFIHDLMHAAGWTHR